MGKVPIFSAAFVAMLAAAIDDRYSRPNRTAEGRERPPRAFATDEPIVERQENICRSGPSAAAEFAASKSCCG